MINFVQNKSGNTADLQLGAERTPTASDKDVTPLENSWQHKVSISRLGHTTSWVAYIGRGTHEKAKVGLQLDGSQGISWVNYLEAKAQKQRNPLDARIARIIHENHREYVGAEPADKATPHSEKLSSRRARFSNPDEQQQHHGLN